MGKRCAASTCACLHTFSAQQWWENDRTNFGVAMLTFGIAFCSARSEKFGDPEDASNIQRIHVFIIQSFTLSPLIWCNLQLCGAVVGYLGNT
jgi:hypothetical protein